MVRNEVYIRKTTAVRVSKSHGQQTGTRTKTNINMPVIFNDTALSMEHVTKNALTTLNRNKKRRVEPAKSDLSKGWK